MHICIYIAARRTWSLPSACASMAAASRHSTTRMLYRLCAPSAFLDTARL